MNAEEEEMTFGLEDATLKWNVSEMVAKPEEGKTVEGSAPSDASEVESVTVRSGVSEDGAETDTDHQFRLEQISVIFPENKLSVITGPTASGSSIICFTPPKEADCQCLIGKSAVLVSTKLLLVASSR